MVKGFGSGYRLVIVMRASTRYTASKAFRIAATASERVEFHHRRHVRRRLRRENVRGEVRYVSAWFDDELTKLEGAE